jgi:hypothetical protein
MTPKLSHLTVEQINQLIQRYYAGERIKHLIAEYRLNIGASELVKLFPPKICEELFCPYCTNTNLIRRYESRQSTYNTSNPFCPTCYHIIDSPCNCGNCRENTYIQQDIIIAKKKELLNNYFSSCRRPIPVSSLLLEHAVYLMTLTRHSLSEDLEFIFPFDKNPVKLAPTSELTNRIINILRQENLINISARSNVEDFIYNEDLTAAIGYYPEKVQWEFLPLLSLKEKREYIAELESLLKHPLPEHWLIKTTKLWHLIALHECLEYLRYLLESRDFAIEEISDKTYGTYETLLKKFSVGQIFNLSWQSIKDTVDYMIQKGIPKSKITSVFTGILLRKADRFLAQKWTVKNSRRDFNCSQTAVSATFFNLFLGLGDSALSTQAPDISEES